MFETHRRVPRTTSSMVPAVLDWLRLGTSGRRVRGGGFLRRADCVGRPMEEELSSGFLRGRGLLEETALEPGLWEGRSSGSLCGERDTNEGWRFSPAELSGSRESTDCGLITHIKINSVYKNKREFILVSVQSSQVPLLQGDTVDHNEVVQVVLDCTCSSWKSSRLDNGVTWGGEGQRTRGRQWGVRDKGFLKNRVRRKKKRDKTSRY